MVICFLADAGSINTINWVKYLSNNYEVHIISFNNNVIDGVKTHPVTYWKKIGKLGYLFTIREIKGILKKIQPDIINGYFISSYGLLSWLSGFRPMVLTAAGTDIFGGFLFSKFRIIRVIVKALIKLTLSGADLILCWTDSMAKRIKDLGGEESKIYTLPRGIDLTLFYGSKTKKPYKKKITIVHTRSFREVYNIPTVLDVVSEIKKRGYNVELVLVGDGPLQKTLEDKVERLGINSLVKFVGRVGYVDVPDVLRSCDLYISLASSDGASSSLFEAMACGLFPVVSNINANTIWIKNGRNGLLVDKERPKEIADKIIQVHEDNNLFKKALKINYAYVKNRLSWETNMKKIESRMLACCSDFRKQRKNP